MEPKKTIYKKHLEWTQQDNNPLDAMEEPLHAYVNNLNLNLEESDTLGMLFVVRLFDASLAGFKAGYELAKSEMEVPME